MLAGHEEENGTTCVVRPMIDDTASSQLECPCQDATAGNRVEARVKVLLTVHR